MSTPQTSTEPPVGPAVPGWSPRPRQPRRARPRPPGGEPRRRTGFGRAALRCEAKTTGDAAATLAAVAESMRELTKLRGTVTLLVPGTLPNDGKVIEDTRPVG